MNRSRFAAFVMLMLPFPLSGCFFLSTTRKLPVPIAPPIIQTVAPEELVNGLDQRWAALDTLNATVEIQASVIHPKEGVAKDYSRFRGHILMRKPEFLRVFVQVPVLGTPALDMATDGKTFTLYSHLQNKAFKGPNTVTKRSTNTLENLRPGFFFDAMMVRGLEKADQYYVTADTDTVEDVAKKHLLLEPEYILSIVRAKGDTQELTPVRVVRFHRDDLLPCQQDIYDDKGNLETQVFYSQYAEFGSVKGAGKYPSSVIIKRPLDGIQIVLTVDNVVENMKLPDDQFAIQIPADTPVQKLE